MTLEDSKLNEDIDMTLNYTVHDQQCCPYSVHYMTILNTSELFWMLSKQEGVLKD